MPICTQCEGYFIKTVVNVDVCSLCFKDFMGQQQQQARQIIADHKCPLCDTIIINKEKIEVIKQQWEILNNNE